jgi:4-cresol dehydrogenase (hydroxylating) flavoprotein subunit
MGSEADTSGHAGTLAALRELLGAANVRDDAPTLARYALCTSGPGTSPLAVAWPASAHEVLSLVALARQYHLPIYPLSTGKNWGYGDACAVHGGQLIVELSRMNRIVHVDPTLAYAVIEPGVTQDQLSRYLREHHAGLWIDCTGAGPDTSFVGNIMERGFGHSPYGNRAQHIAGLQVVLGNGEIVETGFGHYPGAQATYLFPSGVGPYLDGMFTQSNFGVVTRMGIWLMPAAACVNHFICTVARHDDIGPVVEALRPLRLDGSLRSVVHIGNDLRLLSGGQVSPAERGGASAAMSESLRQALCARAGIGAWTVSGALYGSARQVAAARHALRLALKKTATSPVFITDGKLAGAALLARLPGRAGSRFAARAQLGKALFDMNRGIPNGRFLAGAYWRRGGGLPKAFPDGADPARDGCGLMWVSPIIPSRGADLLALHAMVEPIFQAHGFDLFETYSMVNERALAAVLTIAYDKDDASELARAQSCHRAVFALVMQAGLIPYRVGIESMASLDPHADSYWRTVAALKSALDPDAIIAPGRYEPNRAG